MADISSVSGHKWKEEREGGTDVLYDLSAGDGKGETVSTVFAESRKDSCTSGG